MERLTVPFNGRFAANTGITYWDIVDRLAAYEDTGLTPEGVAALQTHPDHAYADYVKALWAGIGGMDKMEELAHAEEQGLLVQLPCKVGDTVYSPRKSSVLEHTVDMFSIDDGLRIHVQFECDMDCAGCPHSDWYQNPEAGDGGCNGEYGQGIFSEEDFGKTVFFTREEAEAKIAKDG